MSIKKAIYVIGKNLTISQVRNRSFLKRESRQLKGTILDLGCGNGEYSYLMAKNKSNHITAVDFNEEHCREIKKRISEEQISNLTVVQGDAHHLPFQDEEFDACFCNTLLEHVENPEGVIEEIHRVVRQGGEVIITIPFLQEVHGDPNDFQRYTPEGLKRRLENNGFKAKRIFSDYGAISAIEYLLLGSVVWRIRLGFRKNFPFGYIYSFMLGGLFLVSKFIGLLCYPLQKKDHHFLTQVTFLGVKSGIKHE